MLLFIIILAYCIYISIILILCKTRNELNKLCWYATLANCSKIFPTRTTITQYSIAIYLPDSFVLMLSYCANLKAIRYESASFNRIVADKSHSISVQ